MNQVFHSVSLFSASAAGSLISAIWEGTVLAAVVFLALRVFPGLSAATRSLIWFNVFSLLVLLHFLPALSVRSTSAAALHLSPIHIDSRWSIAVLAIWAALSLVRGIQLVFSAVHLHQVARRATPIPIDDSLRPLLADTHARRAAILCTSSDVQRPSVFGFFHPRILVPPGLAERLSSEELQQVVLHEMEHLRRADDWTNLLQKIGLVFFPLNPVLLWVERRLCAERELACDDRVLRSTAARKAYAVCLTRLAEYAMLNRGLSLALGAWERQSELVRRVHRILRRPTRSMRRRPAIAASSALIVGSLACAVTLAHSPQFVSFAPYADASLQASGTRVAPVEHVHAIEVAYKAPAASQNSAAPAPQLVKAVMPLRTSSSFAGTHTRRQNIAQRMEASREKRNRQGWVVLTEYREQQTQFAPRVVFAIDRRTQTSYAAVQVEDGWLILQI